MTLNSPQRVVSNSKSRRPHVTTASVQRAWLGVDSRGQAQDTSPGFSHWAGLLHSEVSLNQARALWLLLCPLTLPCPTVTHCPVYPALLEVGLIPLLLAV